MIQALLDEWRSMGLVEWAEHKYGWRCEDGGPIILEPWQRAVLSEYWERRADVSTLFISSVKKTGKTLLNSLITTYRWLTVEHPNVHYTCGNDQDQTAELQVNMIAGMVKRHPVLSRCTKVTRNELTFEPAGARIVGLPMDWQGSGGGNFSTVSFSELWAFTYESNRRMFEELTPIPHLEPPCLRIVDSYAGFEQESELLADMWRRGESGDRVNADWPIFLVGQQLSYVHQGEDAQARCWRGDPAQREAYYEEQRETLRETTFRRLHLNEWVASESVFVNPELWDALIDADYRCPGPDRSLKLYAALDASTKHDYTACVTTFFRDGLVWLGPYRVWKPPTDFDAVEAYMVDLAARHSLREVVYDPFQLEYLGQRLRRRGLRVNEWPQTVSNMTDAGCRLFDLIKQRRLVVYPGADDLRAHVLAAAAKETPRGIRLIKSETGRKIDAAVALAMSCCLADSKRSGGVFVAALDFSPEQIEERRLRTVGGLQPAGLGADKTDWR